MMDLEVDIDEAAEIVISTVCGRLKVETAPSISLAVNAKACDLDYSIGYDLSQTELNAKLLNADEFLRNRAALFGGAKDVPKKIAIVRPHDRYHGFWDFYETTARNSGLTLKVLTPRTKHESGAWHSR